MVRTLLPAGFAGADRPERWPRQRSAPQPESLARSVETLPGVGPTAKRRLARLGLSTVGDLLAHRPRRYEQPLPERRIVDLFGDEEAVIEGYVRRVSGRRRGRLHVLTAHVADDTDEIRATWFNQPWLEQKLTTGTRVRLRGRQNRFGFAVESYDLGDTHDTADFAPVYPASEELSQKQLRASSRLRWSMPVPQATRSRRPSSPRKGYRCVAMPSLHSIVLARSPRRKRGAAGSHSTSCSFSSWRLRAARPSVRPSLRRRCRHPESSSAATATSSRSPSPTGKSG